MLIYICVCMCVCVHIYKYMYICIYVLFFCFAGADSGWCGYWLWRGRSRGLPSRGARGLPPLRYCAVCGRRRGECQPFMLNTRDQAYNTLLYSYLACYVNTSTLSMQVFMSYTGFTRRDTLFIFVWLRHRNT